MADYSPSYTSLVEALRAEFTPAGITDLQDTLIASVSPAGRSAATAVLHRALRDAADPSYEPGDNAHPAVREHFERTGKAI